MGDSTDYLDWVAKAEGDREGAVLMMAQYRDSVAHLIALSCQQTVEKYLKALLIKHRVAFPRTHDLTELAALCERTGVNIEQLKPALGLLQPYAVNVRYPGFEPDRAACDEALRCMDQIRTFCRAALAPLPPDAG